MGGNTNDSVTNKPLQLNTTITTNNNGTIQNSLDNDLTNLLANATLSDAATQQLASNINI